MKIYKYIWIFSLTIVFGQYDYSLEDLNSTSDYYEEYVGTSYFPDQVTLHYFGHYNWGTCTARFGQLNDLYQNLLSNGYEQVKLIGVGKSQHMSYLDNWTNSNNASVCADVTGNPNWNSWDANQRDLFVLDHEGDVVLYQNITNGLPNNLESLLINLINEIPECADGEINNDNPCNPMECYDGQWYEIIIDCAEQEGVPCEGGIYLDPPEGVCCSTCVQYGDTNNDGTLNVIDIVLLVGFILGNEIPNDDEFILSDMNGDGNLDVIDIVVLVNTILN